MNDWKRRTSGAKALASRAKCGTAEAVPFVQSFFPQPVKAVPFRKKGLAGAGCHPICRKCIDQYFTVSSQINRPAHPDQCYQMLADFQDLSNCDLGVCRYFFQGIFLLGKRP
jgi:hypothetical protein